MLSLLRVILYYHSLTKDPEFLVQESADEAEKESSLPLDVVLLNETGQESQSLSGDTEIEWKHKGPLKKDVLLLCSSS